MAAVFSRSVFAVGHVRTYSAVRMHPPGAIQEDEGNGRREERKSDTTFRKTFGKLPALGHYGDTSFHCVAWSRVTSLLRRSGPCFRSRRHRHRRQDRVTDAAGNPFVVAEPTDKPRLTTTEKEDLRRVSGASGQRAARRQAGGRCGPCANRAPNFAWTLNTGYLVLFMQAGFALLTCGLVRKKNAAHLMMLNFAAYVFAFLAYYAVGYAFQFGAVAVNSAPAT